jgi:glycosyltransferase involved in cell wall biosynthesis
LGSKVGGVETFLKGLIKYAPADVLIEFIGISSGATRRPLKKWSDVNLGDKNFKCFPLFVEQDENKKRLIPLAFRFTAALVYCQIDYSDRILLFNRIEPAVIFKNLPSPKLVIIHHDIEKQIKNKGSEVFWSKFPWLYFCLEKYVFGFVNYIYTVSTSSLRYYHEHYPAWQEKVSFLPTWVDTGTFYLSTEAKIYFKQKLKLGPRGLAEKWILFVGRLQETKAPFRLLDTFREYFVQYQAVRLVIIGEGNLKGDVERYISRFGLEGRVILLNAIPQEQLALFYQAADVLLLTSNSEGMPRCVLEALGCGLPVVTTDVGEVRRVVKNGFSGEVVESFVPKDIASAVKKVLDNPQFYTPENCTKSVEDYTPQRVLAQVYEKLRELYKANYGPA